MSTVKAHCNTCGGERNHETLYTEKTSWEHEHSGVAGNDEYTTLKCCGCDNIKLRHISNCSEYEKSEVNYFPAAIFRRNPEWFSMLWLDIDEDDFVEDLLKEIYVALQHDLSSLAAMGVRSLLEKVMISKVQDQGSFIKNISESLNDNNI